MVSPVGNSRDGDDSYRASTGLLQGFDRDRLVEKPGQNGMRPLGIGKRNRRKRQRGRRVRGDVLDESDRCASRGGPNDVVVLDRRRTMQPKRTLLQTLETAGGGVVKQRCVGLALDERIENEPPKDRQPVGQPKLGRPPFNREPGRFDARDQVEIDRPLGPPPRRTSSPQTLLDAVKLAKDPLR